MDFPYPLPFRSKRSGSGWVDLCPAHPDHNHSLSIDVGRTGQFIPKCFAGCAFESILAASGLQKGAKPALSASQLAHQRAADETGRLERVRAAIRIWQSSGELAGTIAEQYLLRRGLTQWSVDQRFHPHLFHSPSNGYRGALVSPVVRGDRLVGFHRIFLDAEGNKLDKMMLGDCRGGAVRLFGSAGDAWSNEGWFIGIDFQILEQPLRPKDHMDKLGPLLPRKYSPIRENGSGNQGAYLAEISSAMADELLLLLGQPVLGPLEASDDQAEQASF